MSEHLGVPIPRARRGFASRVISLSSTTFEELVGSNILDVPKPASLLVEPHLWTSTSADAHGHWHAIGRVLVLGLLTDTIEVHIWCLNTESEAPLDPAVEGQFVLEYISDELVPLLGDSAVTAAVADLFSDKRPPAGPFGSC